ncbi:chlorohydrolase [Streptococcus pneumoniae]|nr:chlorohydrolase [Streptococcus pneumoniae]
MKIKVQTRKLAAGCSKHCFKVVDGTDEVSSKHCFEVVDGTDEVSSKHCFEVVDRTDEVSSKHCFEVVDRTDEVSNHIYGKVKLTWFEEIFEEYKSPHNKTHTIKVFMYYAFFNFKDFLQLLLTHIKLF